MQDFRKLKVWEKAHRLVLDIYRVTGGFPKSEFYGLVSQMRRSAASIPGNLAEGCGRHSDRDFARFVQIALGSASELEYHILLSRDLGFLADERYAALCGQVEEIKRMLTAFANTLRTEADR